jgi:hypothetical protein
MLRDVAGWSQKRHKMAGIQRCTVFLLAIGGALWLK